MKTYTMHFKSLDDRKYAFKILTIVSFLLYFNSLFCGFVFDDVSAIKDNKDLRSSVPLVDLFKNDFWGIPMVKEQSHKSYRPLCVLTYRLNYFLSELQPFGYHLVNVVLHVVVVLLFYLSCSHYTTSKVSLLSSLLFAVHPIHTEAVTGVVGRAELLSSIFFLLALIFYQQAASTGGVSCIKKLLVTCLMSAVAMLSKEQGVTVIGLCLVHELVIEQRLHFIVYRSWLKPIGLLSMIKLRVAGLGLRLFGLCISLGLLLLFRIQVMQGSSLPVFTKFDNPASLAEPMTRILTYSYLPCLNLWLLLCPVTLCCDWTMNSVSLLTSISDTRVLPILLSLALLMHLVISVLRSSDQKVSGVTILATGWIIIPFLPASNAFFPVGFVVAERILYIPSMGFCLLVGLGLSRLLQYYQCKTNSHQNTSKNIVLVTYFALLATYSLKTVIRNFDWINEESIFLSGLQVNVRNAKLYNNVGHALESQKKYNEALVLFKQAAIVQPDDIGAHINIGRTLNALNRYDDAEVAYRSAKRLLPRAAPGKRLVTRVAPNSLSLFLNLGNLVARNRSRLEEADSLYRQAIAMRSDYVQAYINRGDVLLKMNRSELAISVYKQALNFDPTNPDLHYNLGVVALDRGQEELGLKYLNQALEYEPNHPEALLNSVIVIQELGHQELKSLAVERLLRLKDIQPNNERVYFNLGMIAMDEKKNLDAEFWFKKAVQLKSDFRSALFNLALLLADNSRPIEAVGPLNQLLSHHPNHTKALILMGDIYTNHMRDLDLAEDCYHKVLAMVPGHVQAQHNLCVVMVEKGQLMKAKDCLELAHSLAPEEQYIRRHLSIVKAKIAKASGDKS